MLPLVLADPTRTQFQAMLFSKIVPNCKKLGLLDRNDQWLRRRFEEMNVIQFEDWEDTGAEYLKFELGETLEPVAGSDSYSLALLRLPATVASTITRIATSMIMVASTWTWGGNEMRAESKTRLGKVIVGPATNDVMM